MEINEKVFNLHDEGVAPGKIAQKLKIKKADVLDILGDAAKPQGLGDVVETITTKTGIKAAVDSISKFLDKDCGCAARKEKLNEIFPMRDLPELSQETFDKLEKIVLTNYKSVNTPQQKEIVAVYNDAFRAKRVISSCGTCVAKMLKEMSRLYKGIIDDAN